MNEKIFDKKNKIFLRKRDAFNKPINYNTPVNFYGKEYPLVFPKPKCIKSATKKSEYVIDPYKSGLLKKDENGEIIVNIDIIRYELQWDAFDMSGYNHGDPHYLAEKENVNMSCDIHNNKILNRFNKYGIFNGCAFYYLTAYKGNMEFFYLPWELHEWGTSQSYLSIDFGSGYGTEEILIKIFKELGKWNFHRRLM